MCEANAYLMKEDGEELIMEAVDTVEPEDGGIRITNIFGDQKFLRATVHSLSLVDHKVYFKEA
ncbi:MAG: CooT family nickel-binding protein [Desulfatibacillaceae bacterium]